MMDGSNKRGRPHREWSDDIEQWCGATLQELSHAALDRQRWAAIVRMASDTNGHWAHGCRWWWWRWWYTVIAQNGNQVPRYKYFNTLRLTTAADGRRMVAWLHVSYGQLDWRLVNVTCGVQYNTKYLCYSSPWERRQYSINSTISTCYGFVEETAVQQVRV